jgi:tetratricopeptide (TPR) repeat protein
MPTLSVNTFFLILVELTLFCSLWLSLSEGNSHILLFLHLLIAFIASYALSRHWKQITLSHNMSWFMLFTFIFFIPVIGAVILWLFSIRKNLREASIEKQAEEKQEHIEKPTDSLHYFSAPKNYRFSETKKTRDLISTLDDDTYLKLLVASQHLPDKEAYALLEEALSSPFESARLMAFSLKGKLEERLQNALQQKIVNLKETTNKYNVAELNLSIAKDYIHLLDIGLLTENNATLLNKAKTHCVRAIRLNNKSAYAFQALSKVLKHQGRNKQAQRAQIRAVNLGLPLERLYSM